VISPTGGIVRQLGDEPGRRSAFLNERKFPEGSARNVRLRLIARQLGRSASTISREVSRNGGSDRYRASRSDQAAWDRAPRPKLCKLACRPYLSRTVSIKLQRQWSPEQIAGWLKRTYPREPQNQGNHPVSSTAVAAFS
jgi:IS30 family transposase